MPLNGLVASACEFALLYGSIMAGAGYLSSRFLLCQRWFGDPFFVRVSAFSLSGTSMYPGVPACATLILLVKVRRSSREL